MKSALEVLLMVLIGGLGDVLWAKWSMNAASRHALRAANWGAMLPVFGAAAVLIYKDQPVFVVPYAVGCWIGTYFAVSRHK